MTSSKWNKFQKKTSGLGLSNPEKSDLYRQIVDKEIDYQDISSTFGEKSKNPRRKRPKSKNPRRKSPRRQSPRSQSPERRSPNRIRSRSPGSSRSRSPPYTKITTIRNYEDLALNSEKDLIYLYNNDLVNKQYILYSAISKNYQNLIERMLADGAVSVALDNYEALVVALDIGSYKLVDILLKSLTTKQLKSKEIVKAMIKLMSTNPGNPRDPKNHNYKQNNLWKYAAAGLAGLLIGSALL